MVLKWKRHEHCLFKEHFLPQREESQLTTKNEVYAIDKVCSNRSHWGINIRALHPNMKRGREMPFHLSNFCPGSYQTWYWSTLNSKTNTSTFSTQVELLHTSMSFYIPLPSIQNTLCSYFSLWLPFKFLL
jgi:hypothetical protein